MALTRQMEALLSTCPLNSLRPVLTLYCIFINTLNYKARLYQKQMTTGERENLKNNLKNPSGSPKRFQWNCLKVIKWIVF